MGNFSRNCEYATYIVDHLPDILTGDQHRKTSKYIEEQKMLREEEKEVNEAFQETSEQDEGHRRRQDGADALPLHLGGPVDAVPLQIPLQQLLVHQGYLLVWNPRRQRCGRLLPVQDQRRQVPLISKQHSSQSQHSKIGRTNHHLVRRNVAEIFVTKRCWKER